MGRQVKKRKGDTGTRQDRYGDGATRGHGEKTNADMGTGDRGKDQIKGMETRGQHNGRWKMRLEKGKVKRNMRGFVVPYLENNP